ncbi:MAG TPA: ATP-dependent Clp protease adaptor ClpS [Ktedonobacterales bacterium]|jgi:ATP-dependent Clp protease adaptor protein ClpS
MPNFDRWGDNLSDRSGLGRSPWDAQPVAPRTDEEVRLALRQLPHYRVLLYNDDHNTMEHVVIALLRIVPRLSIERAIQVMRAAHTTGVAEVITCPRETAEFYREGLERRGLTSAIEPL